MILPFSIGQHLTNLPSVTNCQAVLQDSANVKTITAILLCVK